MGIQLRDLYDGKPDAKDEIRFNPDMDTFYRCFVAPTNFNVMDLIYDDKCFITGYKGVGKTALNFYLDNAVKEDDVTTCSSFIFFKEEFLDTKKKEMESLAKRIISSIDIDSANFNDEQDYEYIWRWLIYRRIIDDNEAFNYGVFYDDDNWVRFTNCINRIAARPTKQKFKLPAKLKIAVPILDSSNPSSSVTTEFELDFSDTNNTKVFNIFMEVIDEAEELFKKLSRTDIPYFIFVDELEAYYGDERIFYRDLKMIRDLIFTTKYFNLLYLSFSNTPTKILCSVRTEILNAINRFVITKEINKVTSGFECPLKWNYANTNSYHHPIIQILLKRIQFSCERRGIKYPSDKDLYFDWFPDNINGQEPAAYILNNTWHKPRDIVRLLSAAKSCLLNSETAFTQAVFDTSIKKYSQDSLDEIKEELRALYTSKEIDEIIQSLTGFQPIFKQRDLVNRLKSSMPDSFIIKQTADILADLYRLGVLGNYSASSHRYRWQHKGDDGIILLPEWDIMVHDALHGALSITSHNASTDFGINEHCLVKIEKISPSALYVVFVEKPRNRGSIHVSRTTKTQWKDVDLYKMFKCGEQLTATVIGIRDSKGYWKLSLIED